MRVMQTSLKLSSLVILSILLMGCGAIVSHYTRPLMADLTRSLMSQKDVTLAEQGTPSFLLLIDGLIMHSPEDKALLLAGAQAYGSYGSAFIGTEQPERFQLITERAKDYATRAMSIHNAGFRKVKDLPHEEFITFLPSLEKKDIPYLFQTASSWLSWIQARSDSWDAVADLPKIQSMIERVLAIDEQYYYGSAHSMMGALLTIRPPALGGKPEEARKHFERALEIGGDSFLLTHVLYARQYAKLVYNKEIFEQMLNKVIQTPVDTVPELSLINTLAQKQARELLDWARKEEYFE